MGAHQAIADLAEKLLYPGWKACLFTATEICCSLQRHVEIVQSAAAEALNWSRERRLTQRRTLMAGKPLPLLATRQRTGAFAMLP